LDDWRRTIRRWKMGLGKVYNGNEELNDVL
jgi:hypothetical protein